MDKATTDELDNAATRLEATMRQLLRHGITADDLESITSYLHAVINHCLQVSSRVIRAIDNADPTHPIHNTHGRIAQSTLRHTHALFDAALYFADDTAHDIWAMNHNSPP
jgi:hypothetical protein